MSGIQSTGSAINVHSSSSVRNKPTAPKKAQPQQAEPKDKVSLSAPEETYQRRPLRQILQALRQQHAPEPGQAEKTQNLQDYSRRMLEDYTRGH